MNTEPRPSDPTSPTEPDGARGPDPDAMRREWRRWRNGALLADGTPEPVVFVADPRSGRLLMPVSTEAADAEERVLWIPEESHDAMQALLEARIIEEDAWTPALEALRDRCEAYHGKVRAPAWILCEADSVKWRSEVHEGPLVLRPNAVADIEPALLRLINRPSGGGPSRAGALASRFEQARTTDAVAVGVDEDGIDVRSRVGVLRVTFAETARNADEAEAIVRRMLDEARDA